MLFLSILSLFTTQLSYLLGNVYIALFTFIGTLLEYVIILTEEFYEDHPEYKERIVLQFIMYQKELLLSSQSIKLLKAQLKNTGNKQPYSFLQKLSAGALQLVFGMNEKEANRYFTHKLSTIKNYLYMIRRKGLFVLMPRRSMLIHPHKKSDQIVQKIWEVHDANPSWGRFKISGMLFLLGFAVSPSTVRNYLNKKRPPEKKKSKYYKKKAVDACFFGRKITANYPNHVHMCDFTCVKVFFTYVYVFFVIDVYSRKVLYFDINRMNPTADWTITRFKRAFAESIDTPKYVVTDNGEQFKSGEFKQFAKDYGFSHRRGKAYSWKATARIERFNNTIKYEALHHITFFTVKYLRKMIVQFVEYYNRYRSHQALEDLTPDMKYYGLQARDREPDDKMVKRKCFCKGLITAFYVDEKKSA